ncbi:hypothetical protein C0Q70_06965 [Pomacea canaliculata]|uniref:Secreted protein n=1 Tax=Pomacea canaliculata TaxID=400727 RepID=A0A2T7PDQ4_POMCA|nr:hypothetical protein C0Q70_06965 [Pomacea canaliculata]
MLLAVTTLAWALSPAPALPISPSSPSPTVFSRDGWKVCACVCSGGPISSPCARARACMRLTDDGEPVSTKRRSRPDTDNLVPHETWRPGPRRCSSEWGPALAACETNINQLTDRHRSRRRRWG